MRFRRRETHGTRTRILLLGALLGSLSGSAVGTPQMALSKSTVSWGASTSSPLPTTQVLRRTLRADTSQEYLLYVPGSGGDSAPVFVAVHGISRNFEEHANLLAPYAERYGAVLVAPVFTRAGHDDYQRLGRVGRGPRADLALEAILEEVRTLTGAQVEKFYLFGFSGGAQFAHRYALAHPERVARAVVAASGWYTFPDRVVPYPYGLGASAELPAVRFDPKSFLRVPILVVVGEADIESESLRRNPGVDRQQGETRRERAERWTEAMRHAAVSGGYEPRVTCVQVPGIRHSFRQFMEEGRLGERVFGFMFGPGPVKSPSPGGGR